MGFLDTPYFNQKKYIEKTRQCTDETLEHKHRAKIRACATSSVGVIAGGILAFINPLSLVMSGYSARQIEIIRQQRIIIEREIERRARHEVPEIKKRDIAIGGALGCVGAAIGIGIGQVVDVGALVGSLPIGGNGTVSSHVAGTLPVGSGQSGSNIVNTLPLGSGQSGSHLANTFPGGSGQSGCNLASSAPVGSGQSGSNIVNTLPLSSGQSGSQLTNSLPLNSSNGETANAIIAEAALTKPSASAHGFIEGIHSTLSAEKAAILSHLPGHHASEAFAADGARAEVSGFFLQEAQNATAVAPIEATSELIMGKLKTFPSTGRSSAIRNSNVYPQWNGETVSYNGVLYPHYASRH